MHSYVTSLDTEEDALEVVGGKGRSLAKLANAGSPVPGGFQVTVAAYRRFVAANNLQARIARSRRDPDHELRDPAAWAGLWRGARERLAAHPPAKPAHRWRGSESVCA